MPRVSVIIPVYNGARYLRYALESILEQTYRDFEIVVINDGSTDESESVVRSYNDPRINLHTQQNIGLTRTLNRLIELANGAYLARMDQDDWSHPERLQIQVEFLQNHTEVKMCGSWIQAIDVKNNLVYSHKYPVTNHAIHEEMLLSNPFAHGSIMVRKGPDVYYRTEYDDAEDMDHWARLCETHVVANLPHFLYHWRVNPEGMTHTRLQTQQSTSQRILERYRSYYLSHFAQRKVSRDEIIIERQAAGTSSILKRKLRLFMLFRRLNRPELAKRQLHELFQTLTA